MSNLLQPIPFEFTQGETVSFEAPERLRFERGKIWYAAMAIGFFLLVAYAVYSGAWTFAIALLLFAGVYVLISHEHPKMTAVKIDHRGLTFGKRHYSFNALKSFWIEEVTPQLHTLNFGMDSRFAPDLVIALDHETSEESVEFIRAHLARFLEEEKNKTPRMTDTLIRLLKI